MKIKLSCLFFLLSVWCNSCILADEIELRISRQDVSRKYLWLHIISHAKNNIRQFTFHNGSGTDIHMANSSGHLVPQLRFTPPVRGQIHSNRRPFTIYPGDTSGAVVCIKEFKVPADGIYYMVYAIPDPEGNGIIVSSPCKLFIKNNEFESVDQISFNDLPDAAKNTFRTEFEKFMNEERIPLESLKLPF